jgi:hypothetical protein
VVDGGKIVEVAGVKEDVVVAEEVDDEVFVGSAIGGVCGIAEDGVPAGFAVEEFTGRVRAELGLEMGKIFFDAG